MSRTCLILTLLGQTVLCQGGEKPVANGSRAASLVSVLRREMEVGLARRGVRAAYDRYQAYSAGRLDATAGPKRWRDKTGNCRLGWYDRLLRDQLSAPSQAEHVSRQLHEALRDRRAGLGRALAIMAEKLDLPRRELPPSAPGNALQTVKAAVAAARRAHDAALLPLTPDEREDLRRHLYTATTAQVTKSGARFPDATTGRRMCDLLERMDRQSLYAAARALAPLTDPTVLTGLATLPAGADAVPKGVQGEVHSVVATAAGTILVGGRGPNVYDLDALEHVCAVIDVGGDDVYKEGTVSAKRPVLVIVDLAGNDTYRGTKPGIQGAAIGGVSLLVDVAGNDTYQAQDVAQGACLAGVGILIDHAGNDSYRGLRRAHGSAMGGLAVMVDRAGDDRYHAALYAQGFGGPLGFGLMDDLGGNDHYYAGGLYLDGYKDTPGYSGFSQGVGSGPRGVANGGIGVLLDGGGDDVYQCDYFSHGGGYWFAVGIARDFGGNDRRLGSTRLAYDGKPRQEKVFLRWGMGWQAHYGLGFVIDDEGDDVYGGTIVGLGFSWDIGVAAILDFQGNDQYLTRVVAQAQGKEAALGIIFDVGGDDVYAGPETGKVPAKVSYHPMPDCGGNFGFSVNYGGTDTYNDEVMSDVYLKRASPTGFLIDRSNVPTLDALDAERAGGNDR